MNATLHHSSQIGDTMQGVARVIADDGVVLVVSEPVRSVLWPHDLTGCPEIAHGINEHVYTIFDYVRAALDSGLLPKLYLPRSIERSLDRNQLVAAQELGRGYAIIAQLWRRKLGRSAVRGWLLPVIYVIANMPLVMVARKKRARVRRSVESPSATR